MGGLRIENEKTDATVQHQLRFGCRRLYDLYDTNIGRIRYSLMPFSPKENQWRKLLPWVDTCSPGSKRVAVASTTSSIRKFIDWERIKRMLQDCLLNHQACSVNDSKSPPRNFRLIDVQQRKLTYMDSHTPYVALSYLWGSNPSENFLQAFQSNIAELERQDSLNRERLPATIHDAMEACRRLDQRYLWVDRLCILQDK